MRLFCHIKVKLSPRSGSRTQSGTRYFLSPLLTHRPHSPSKTDLEEAKVKAEALEIEKAKLVKQSTETTKKADALQREYDEKTRQLAEERERSIQLEEKTTTLTEELKKKEARLDAQTKVRFGLVASLVSSQ